MAERDMQKPMKNLEFYQLPSDVFKGIEHTSTFLELVLCLSCEVVMAWLDGPDE